MDMDMDRKIIVGFKTIILGLCLYILELLFLPVFGALQKAQINGDGFYSDFLKYAGEQPYPIIFALTGIIVILGVIFMVSGAKKRSKFQFIEA